MFFAIGRESLDNFPNRVRINNLWFNHDNGWHQQDDSWYKGYPGNFCKITLEDHGKITVRHDPWRSFALWYDRDSGLLTNLQACGQCIYADRTVTLYDHDISTEHHPVSSDPSLLIGSASIENVIDSLSNNFEQAHANLTHWPSKVYVSGGLDTMVNTALARQHRDIQIIDHEHFDGDHFVDHNIGQLRSDFWGYAQIHHWCSNTVLITGGCGDEYLMRGPGTVAIWCAWHDIDMLALAQNRPHCYMSRYYALPKNQSVFQQQWLQRQHLREICPTYQDLAWYIADNLVNDHQHWHLGNTLTMTPMRDITLAIKVLSLPFDEIIQQMLDGVVNRALIQKFWPELECLISDAKNQDPKQHLHRLCQTLLTR